MQQRDVAVVGAGPYGLALAAACRAAGRSTVIFGPALETWRQMPAGMELRAAWKEMSLTRANEPGSLEEWCSSTGMTPHEPMTVTEFIAYATWFGDRYAGERTAGLVTDVETGAGARLSVRTNDASWHVSEVVIAPGIGPFPYVPDRFAESLDDPRVGLAAGYEGADDAGRRVAVVGGGQSALEAAATAVRSGAETTLLARSGVHWFTDHEPSRPRGELRRRAFELAYPAVGYGPPPLNRLVLHPDLFARLPVEARRRLSDRLLRPGGSPWLRAAVVGKATIEEGVEVTTMSRTEAGVSLSLTDGRTAEFDRVLFGTGYRFRLDALAFLSPELRSRIRLEGGWPVLDRAFRTTERRIRLVGFPAEGRFGPIARFVLGVPFTAARVATTLS